MIYTCFLSLSLYKQFRPTYFLLVFVEVVQIADACYESCNKTPEQQH